MLGISLLLIPNMNSARPALTLRFACLWPAVAAGGSLAVTPEEQGAVAGFNFVDRRRFGLSRWWF